MTVETASYISQLNATYPTGADAKNEGDDHVRLLKNVLKTQFPNFGAAAINASTSDFNQLTAAVSATVSGDFGVGTTSPVSKAEIAATDYNGLTISRDANGAAGGTFAQFREKNSANTWKQQNLLQSYWANAAAGAEVSVLVLTQFSAGNSSEVLRVQGGNFICQAPASPPSLSANGQLVMNLTTNTNLRISVRGSDGVTRTANITLS